LYRRFRSVAKCGSDPDICYAAPPLAVDQRSGDVNTVPWYDAVLWAQVGCWEAQFVASFCALFHSTLDAVRSTQHTSRKIYLAPRQKFANLARTHTTSM